MKIPKVDYERLMSMTASDRSKEIKNRWGNSLLSMLTPSEYASMFPTYYKDSLPDIGLTSATSGATNMSYGSKSTYTVPNPEVRGSGPYKGRGGAPATSKSGVPNRVPAPAPKFTQHESNKPKDWKSSVNEAYQASDKKVVPKQSVKASIGKDIFNRGIHGDELNNPEVKEKILALTMAEVGTKNESAQRALMETIFNRTAAHKKKSLSDTMSYAYYEPFQNGAFNRRLQELRSNPDLRANLEQRLEEVLSGSNDSNFATHNGSAGVAANARVTQSVAAEIGGETFTRKDNADYKGIHGAGTVKNEAAWFNGVEKAAEIAAQTNVTGQITPEQGLGPTKTAEQVQEFVLPENLPEDVVEHYNGLGDNDKRDFEAKIQTLGAEKVVSIYDGWKKSQPTADQVQTDIDTGDFPIPEVGDDPRFNRIKENPHEYKSNVTRIDTPFGPATVSNDAAVAYKGFFSDLNESGAPIKKLGSFLIRKKKSAGAGHNPGDGWSQHSYGNAVDLDDAAQLSDEMEDWIKNNPGKLDAIKKKWGMLTPRNDEPHMEFGGKISQEAFDQISKKSIQEASKPVEQPNNTGKIVPEEGLGPTKPPIVAESRSEAKPTDNSIPMQKRGIADWNPHTKKAIAAVESAKQETKKTETAKPVEKKVEITQPAKAETAKPVEKKTPEKPAEKPVEKAQGRLPEADKSTDAKKVPVNADGGEVSTKGSDEIRVLPIRKTKGDDSVIVNKEDIPLSTINTKNESMSYDKKSGHVSVTPVARANPAEKRKELEENREEGQKKTSDNKDEAKPQQPQAFKAQSRLQEVDKVWKGELEKTTGQVESTSSFKRFCRRTKDFSESGSHYGSGSSIEGK